MSTTNRWRLSALGLVAAGALLLSGCSSDSGTHAAPSRQSNDGVASTATTTVAGADSTELCAIFNRLAASGAGPGAQFNESTPEGWERRIATNTEIVLAAPAEWKDEAETYLQMVKDRAQLAAEHGYVGVNDLPADVRNAFIDAHREMQAEVNELIAYMGQECGARGQG
jgi:hypothetical protein